MANNKTALEIFRKYFADHKILDLNAEERALPFQMLPAIIVSIGVLMILASTVMPAFYSPELSVTSGNMVFQYIPGVILTGLAAGIVSVALYRLYGCVLSTVVAIAFGFISVCLTIIYSYSGQFVNLLHVNVVTIADYGLWFNGLGDLAIVAGGLLMARHPGSTWLRVKDELSVWAASFALSMALSRHVEFFFDRDLARSVQASQGVLDGYPHWRHFQSRLLGPWLAETLTNLGGVNFSVAHIIIAVTVIALASVVMFHAGRTVSGRPGGWAALFAFQTLYVLMMSRPWLYVWDYFILLTGALFLLLVVRRAPWWAFLALMSVAYFNHETAAYIGVWMVSQALADAWAARRRPDWRLLGAGILGGLAGQILTEYLRASLLKREIGWEIFPDVGKGPTSPLDAYFHVQISANINDITNWVDYADRYFMLLIPLTLVVAIGMAVHLVRRHGTKAAGLAVYAAVQILALLAFGMRSETRNLLQLVPFLSLAGMLATNQDWCAASPIRTAKTSPEAAI